MEIILTNPSNGRKYKITPHDNGLCFSIWQTTLLKKGEKAKNGKAVKHEWQHTGKYPFDLACAINIVRSLMLMDKDSDPPFEIDAKEIDKLDRHMKQWQDRVLKTIEIER